MFLKIINVFVYIVYHQESVNAIANWIKYFNGHVKKKSEQKRGLFRFG